MRYTSLTALSSVSLGAMALGLSSPAYGQATAHEEPDPVCQQLPAGPERDRCLSGEVELESGADQTNVEPVGTSEIVVTGTRINQPAISSPVPVTSVGVQDLASAGNVSLGDKLAELPQIRATFTQANSTRFIGTAGINALDLRGLGTSRTLVLVNGRRIVTATPGVNRPDVNAIPVELVERIDIVTGGNSAIYGSDAVAGVVNFVTKKDFEGIRLNGQAGASSRGDRGSYFLSATVGRNLFDDRANIAVSAEYAKQDTLWATDRDDQTGAFSGRSQFNLVEFTGINRNPAFGPIGGPEPATGNGIPDTAFLTGVRNNNISEGGLFTAFCPLAPAPGEAQAQFQARRAVACSGLPNPGSTNPLAQFGRTFVFLPDGTLVANPCITDLRGPTGGNSSNCIGGLGSTLRLTSMLSPGLERYAINLLGHFEVSPAFEPFVEARYVNVEANQSGQPTFFNNTFSLQNPFLTDQARAQLRAVLAPGATTFSAFRFNVDFGGRGELHERENYQLVGGARGAFNDDWRYEIALNYGRLETFYETKGNVNRANYARAINAVRHPTTGQIVCAVNADANPTNDDPACVPANLFGHGNVSQAALDYFLHTSSREQEANLYNGLAYLAGDTSQLFELPAGPVAFVLGAEYRQETAFAAYDELTASTACGVSGCTFLNVIPDFRPPDLEVKELFGEVNVPFLRGVPFADELSFSAAGRLSDYNVGSTGTVFAWNINGIYAPIRDLRFRAGLARAIRAPTQSDLFSPATQTFVNGFQDPCAVQNINNNPNRAANCAAAGVPTTQTFNGTTEPFTNRPASGIAANNQGNPNLGEERGTSLTLGAVLQPRFVPGLSLTVDYYEVEVDDVIFSLGGQTIINQCYDAPGGINNPFCAVVFRNPNGTLAGQSNVIHGGTTVSLTPTGPSVLVQPFNFAKLDTSGIDFDLAYRTRLGPEARLNLRGIVSHVLKKNAHSDITDPDFRDRILSELGDPEWQAQLSTNVEWGIFNLGHRVRYVHRQTIAAEYETQNPFDGNPPRNPDAFPQVWYPNLWFHDLRVDMKPTDRYRFYLGVDNAFDRLPPLDLLGTESGAPSPVGRFFYAGAMVHF